MSPEDHRRSLGRLARITAQSHVSILRMLAAHPYFRDLHQVEIAQLIDELTSGIKAVCEPVDTLPLAPGRMVTRDEINETDEERRDREERQRTMRMRDENRRRRDMLSAWPEGAAPNLAAMMRKAAEDGGDG